MSLFTNIKDTAVSFAGEKVIKNLLKEYGDLDNLSIDSKNKRIILKLSLKGEKEPVLITLNDYEFIEKQNQTFLQINHLVTSREWINLVVEKYVQEKKFEIPQKYAGIIKFLL